MAQGSGVIRVVEDGVTTPKGFLAAAVSCGIKQGGKKDLALLYSKNPALAAAVFTVSKTAGAPVIVSKKHIQNGRAQAVAVNSGCANTCTGEEGQKNAVEMARITGNLLGLNPYDVLVASTGVIGTPLPMDKIREGLREAANNLSPGRDLGAAEAIMTTDTVPKERACQFELEGKTIHIGGMAKGAGMIAPDMVLPPQGRNLNHHGSGQATMIAILTTDAQVDLLFLKEALKKSVDKSFNRITVDGETSPNDMVLILANGLAGNKELTPSTEGREGRIFQEALDFVTLELAKMIVRDGEGATKFIEIKVQGARSQREAKAAAFAVANSPLVKTAFFGEDPNWGRIMAALGHASTEINPDEIDIYFGEEQVVRGGRGLSPNIEKVREILRAQEVKVTINLNVGQAQETVWTSDLSYDYVRINAKYHT